MDMVLLCSARSGRMPILSCLGISEQIPLGDQELLRSMSALNTERSETLCCQFRNPCPFEACSYEIRLS